MSASLDAREVSQLRRNTTWLLALQAMNYAAPLVLTPYLTRVLGINGYATWATTLALLQLGLIVTDYGFSMSMPLRLASRSARESAVHRIVSAAFVVKTALLVVVAISVTAYCMYTDRWYWALALLPLAGLTFQPLWYFQSFECMSQLAVYTAVSRLGFVALAVGMVDSSTDLALVPICYGITSALGALICLLTMRRMGQRYLFVSVHQLKREARQSFGFFLARVSVSVYGAGTVMMLAVAAGPVNTALFAGCQQFFMAGQAITTSAVQAIYPYAVRTRNTQTLAKLSLGIICISLVCVALSATIGGSVLSLVLGAQFQAAQPVLIVFSAILGVAGVSAVYGYPFFGATGRAYIANRTILLGGAVQIGSLLVLALIGRLSVLSAVFCVLAAEVTVLLARLMLAQRGSKGHVAQVQ